MPCAQLIMNAPGGKTEWKNDIKVAKGLEVHKGLESSTGKGVLEGREVPAPMKASGV